MVHSKIRKSIAIIIVLACSIAVVCPVDTSAKNLSMNGVDEFLLDNEVATPKSFVTQDSFISEFPFYPPTRTHGDLSVNTTNKDTAQVAHWVADTMMEVNPASIIDESTLLMVTSDIVSKHAENIHYQALSQIALFPTDVPSGAIGAIIRIDYWYDFYDGSVMTPEYQLGDTLHAVYYGMP